MSDKNKINILKFLTFLFILFFRTTDPLNTMYYNPLTFMAGAIILAIPIMIVNIFMQKYCIRFNIRC